MRSRFCLAGEQVVHGGELAGDADRGPDELSLRAQIVAGHADRARIGGKQGGQDPDGCGLAGTVRAEQREDRALGDVQVDAVEDQMIAVGLPHPSGDHGGSGGAGGQVRGHGPMLQP